MQRLVLVAFALVSGIVGPALSAAAQTLGDIPLPISRPETTSDPVPAIREPIAFEMSGVIPRSGRLVPVSRDLKAGLDALSNKDGAAAIAARNRMPAGLDRHILTWSIGVSGLSSVPSGEIAAAEEELKGWPGLAAFRINTERALAREAPSPGSVIDAFGDKPPETPQGTILLARALQATGRQSDARSLLVSSWRSEALDASIEDRILAEFPDLLTKADHKARMDYLMYRGRATQAKRFSTLGEAQSLFNAWNAVVNRAGNTTDLIKRVDASWSSDPALLFIRIKDLRHQEAYVEAAKLLATAPSDKTLLINPDEWWNEQRIVARGMADRGDFKTAYRLTSRHLAVDPVDVVDAEFHAGWYALRALKDPGMAAPHFRKILETSTRPLSASRAHYWLGRTAEEARTGDADQHYAAAAAYPSTFYGQLAAARLKKPGLDISYPMPTAADRKRFSEREAVQAISRFEAAGHGWRAASLYRALADQLESPGELAILAAQAERGGDHQLSLQIGKTAYGRGIDVPALAFPVGVIPSNANIEGSGKALAYAIARQESAFNPAAVSGANARGLLQLLPGTAKGVATRHGLAYAPEKLTVDPGYNATLGAHYLGEQIDSFGGSYILTFIAYNAGPGRVPQWIARYGNPQGKPIDEVVDWIERIPFPETRNYVQRVMENYQIYKARLGDKPDIEHDLRFGR